MQFGETMVAMLGTVMVFGIPLTIIWTAHKRKMLEMQLRLRGDIDNNVRTSVEALRDELRQLRETSMQYDMSFDTALQRMEQRMQQVERSVNTNEAQRQVEAPLQQKIGQ